MLVTPSAISTAPAHESLAVTTLVVIVNVPEDPQFTGPSATACAGLIAKPDSTSATVEIKMESRRMGGSLPTRTIELKRGKPPLLMTFLSHRNDFLNYRNWHAHNQTTVKDKG